MNHDEQLGLRLKKECCGRCVASIQQAESLFGVSLNYHHVRFSALTYLALLEHEDVFETLFFTDSAQRFCAAWDAWQHVARSYFVGISSSEHVAPAQ